MEQLAGKVAFVTGAGAGIGLGIARACVAAGMKVAVADIHQVAVHRAAAELTDLGGEAIPITLDVTDRDGWIAARDHVQSALGPVQLLVNNAGVGVLTLGRRIDELGDALWDRVMDINVTGVYNGVCAMLDAMRTAGGGHIVNTASMAGLIGGAPMIAAYAASKFAVVGFSEALRAELAESAIGVSVLCPGPVRTDISRSSRAVLGIPIPESLPGHVRGFNPAEMPDTMDADEVGRRVLDAVLADEPYVFTHPKYRETVSGRHERLLHGFDVAERFTG